MHFKILPCVSHPQRTGFVQLLLTIFMDVFSDGDLRLKGLAGKKNSESVYCLKNKPHYLLKQRYNTKKKMHLALHVCNN